MEETFFQCPYCWEEISMLVDVSVPNQTYVEDCEVCCNPIEVRAISDGTSVIQIDANSIEQ
ncbi:CPXCG motif-containing cysteine-rich protein [Winogradskyella litorisediminis]|uniref:CPXCG motif-containing cysteine-rich protein n=1 Tax=Winogradskyella litorisediminis TaxID=1156618 RepID=A0ABW3N9V1_9FLAO